MCLLTACQSRPVVHVPEGDHIASVEVVLKKIAPLTIEPDITVVERTEIQAIADIVLRHSIWINDPTSKVAPMPDADGYQYWLILRLTSGGKEVVGVMEAEMIRNGLRAPINRRELGRLDKACGVVTVGPIKLD